MISYDTTLSTLVLLSVLHFIVGLCWMLGFCFETADQFWEPNAQVDCEKMGLLENGVILANGSWQEPVATGLQGTESKVGHRHLAELPRPQDPHGNVDGLHGRPGRLDILCHNIPRFCELF